ncbi:interleukin-6-like [Chiloscyllium punctatum]|uniref:interleukin-6-like n=1 Tax=Chiloscyllium punctatum TaxID=137246 RepID=UPI003B63B08E
MALEDKGAEIVVDLWTYTLEGKNVMFQVPQVTYLGYKTRLHQLEEKMKLIKGALVPMSALELKSFLGLVNAYGKLIHDLASRLACLHLLLKKDSCQVFLVLFAGLAAFPVTELSGREVRLPSAALTCSTCVPLAMEIRNTAAELRNIQLCEFFSLCEQDWSSLLSYDFDLPQIRAQDRCLKINFHKQTCLEAIASGLQKYKPFLLLVETSISSSNDRVTWMRSSTQHLADLIMNQVSSEFGITNLHQAELEVPISDLASNSDWSTQVTVHVILRDFTKFIEGTARAIRFMRTQSRV